MNELNELECKMLGRPFVPEEVPVTAAPAAPAAMEAMEVEDASEDVLPPGPVRKRRGVFVSSA